MQQLISTFENHLKHALRVKGEAEENFNLEERMLHHHVPGLSLAIINNGEVEWAKSYGVKQSGSPEPVTPETLFQAASISKPVMAAAAMRLVQEGLLDLDEDVNLKLKSWQVPENEFTGTEKVTLRRLLSHTAGLTVHGFGGYAEGEPVPSLQQILDGQEPANSEPVRVDTLPGSLWRYSGGGSTIVQQLLMDVLGKPFPQILQELVLERAGMLNSVYSQPLSASLAGREAAAHHEDGQPYKGSWHTYPELAAAGLWTTPADLARYTIEIRKAFLGQSEKLLNQEIARQMLTPHLGSWGLGPHIGKSQDGTRAWFEHGGSNAGFRCRFLMFLESGQGFVAMSNAEQGTFLISEIQRSLAHTYGWEDHLQQERERISLDKETLKACQGVFGIESIPGLQISIVYEADRLMVNIPGFLTESVELYPQAEDLFFIKEHAEEIRFSAKHDSLEFYFPEADTRLIAQKIID